jgi:hypothetical protein
MSRITLNFFLSFIGLRVLPSLHGIALAGLLILVQLGNGTASAVYKETPQTIADHAYRELWSGHTEGPHGAIDMFRRALAMDTAFPYRWSDLGDALAAAGRVDSARYCFRRSLELAPTSPQIAMRAANFHFREGETGPALQLGATVLRLTNTYDGMVFNTWVRLGGNVNDILQSGIGTNRRAAESFFRFLIARPAGAGEDSMLSATWTWMERRSYVTGPLAMVWADWLNGRRRDSDAFLVWKRYVAQNSTYGSGNWIDNAGFETEPAGQGFDWRLQPSPGVKAGLDSATAHSGQSSLRIEFDGSGNIAFHHIAQRVWLPPGRYRLTAWMRTANLSTDQGLALVLNGVSTPAPTGSHDWTMVGADVTVRDGASAGEVQVVRQRSWRFDGKLRGVVWIDDVELRNAEKADH